MPMWLISHRVRRKFIAYWRSSTGAIMRAYALTTAVLTALASQASAADLGPPTYSSARSWSWTGCYLGGHAGGLSSHQEWINQTPGGDFFGVSLGEHDQDGLIAGVQAGCDYQTVGRLVIGIQGNYAWTNAEGSHPSARETGVFYHSDIDALASITGRIGYAWDRFLGYVKGGVAWQRDDYWATTLILGTAYTASDTRSGWTIGGGGEYALTTRLSAFIDYGYYDFGDPRIGLTPQVVGLRRAFVDLEETTNVVRAGFNLRFGG